MNNYDIAKDLRKLLTTRWITDEYAFMYRRNSNTVFILIDGKRFVFSD